MPCSSDSCGKSQPSGALESNGDSVEVMLIQICTVYTCIYIHYKCVWFKIVYTWFILYIRITCILIVCYIQMSLDFWGDPKKCSKWIFIEYSGCIIEDSFIWGFGNSFGSISKNHHLLMTPGKMMPLGMPFYTVQRDLVALCPLATIWQPLWRRRVWKWWVSYAPRSFPVNMAIKKCGFW